MKRTLIIALCCLSVLFAACNKEKPYEKFIGDYEGSGTINGTMSLTIFGQTSSQEIKDMAVAMNVNLAPGDADDKVILTYTNDDIQETYTTTGLITDKAVDFEPVTVNITMEGYSAEVTLDLAGNLVETILSLNGTITGDGTVDYNGYPVPYTIDGTVTANLNKIIVTPTN